MSRSLRSLSLLALAAILLGSVSPATAGPPPGIDWEESLTKAFAKAEAAGKPVLVCINATRVAGKGYRLEPAAKELRQKTYRHADVVKLSKEFCCVFISSDGEAEDFGEMRARFQIDGDIVSPQHVFAYPDGRMLYRKEYWPYGTGQEAVDALLKMMNDALAKHRARTQSPEDSGGSVTPGDGQSPEAGVDLDVPDVPPEDPDGRAKWIAAQLRRVGSTDEIMRRDALDRLLEADVVSQVLALLEEYKRQPIVLTDIIRELGRPGLEVAVKPLCDLLSHREATVRAHAAVSLEYVGSKTAVKSLSSRAGREKDPATANHMYRALGRCGAYDAKVRTRLIKAITGAASDFASYGPIIGLSYFEKDEKTARALEKVIKAVGMPSGGRGSGQGGSKRSLLGWCLSEAGFGDPKAAAFVEEEIIPAVGTSRWARTTRSFYRAVRDVCKGDEEAMPTVENGARRALSGGGAGGRYGGRGSGEPTLTDEARLRRDHIGFAAKGEFGPIGG